MSADDAVFVQVNSKFQLVAQYGFISDTHFPDPEKAKPHEIFDSMRALTDATLKAAQATEYGYQFHLGDLSRPDLPVDERVQIQRDLERNLGVNIVDWGTDEPTRANILRRS